MAFKERYIILLKKIIAQIDDLKLIALYYVEVKCKVIVIHIVENNSKMPTSSIGYACDSQLHHNS